MKLTIIEDMEKAIKAIAENATDIMLEDKYTFKELLATTRNYESATREYIATYDINWYLYDTVKDALANSPLACKDYYCDMCDKFIAEEILEILVTEAKKVYEDALIY